MACDITILDIDVFGSPGQPISSVLVKGSATECTGVEVTISCDGHEYYQGVNVTPTGGTTGTWVATFLNPACICDPTKLLRVSARCKANPNCEKSETVPLACQPPYTPCPELGEITSDPAGACFAPDTKVVFTVQVNDPAGCIGQYLWLFSQQPGQCTGGANPPCPGGAPASSFIKVTPVSWISIPLSTFEGFKDGNWTVQVLVDPIETGGCANCPPVLSPPRPFSILAPGTCPTVLELTVNTAGTSSAGFAYNFTATLAGNTSEAKVTWDFGDGPNTSACLCGHTIAQATHTYSRDKCNTTQTVIVTIEPGNGCCLLQTEAESFTLPPCESGGGNGDDHPCPWWNPFCKGLKICGALLAAALAAVLAAGVLAMVAGCTVPVSGPLIVAAAVAAVVSFVLLGLWFAVCRHLPGFCDSLTAFLDLLSYLMYVQAVIVIALAILAALGVVVTLPCVLGAVATFGYYASVYFWLSAVGSHAGCPGHSPPAFSSMARPRVKK